MGRCIVCHTLLRDARRVWATTECLCPVACSRKCMSEIAWPGPGCPVCLAQGSKEKPEYEELETLQQAGTEVFDPADWAMGDYSDHEAEADDAMDLDM